MSDPVVTWARCADGTLYPLLDAKGACAHGGGIQTVVYTDAEAAEAEARTRAFAPKSGKSGG